MLQTLKFSFRRASDLLSLFFCSVQCVDRDNSIRLVWEKATGVVYVNHRGTGEYSLAFSPWIDCNGLVLPMKEITGCSMAPMLISCNSVGGIVYYEQISLSSSLADRAHSH